MYYNYISWNVQTTNDCFLDCAYCMTSASNLLKKKSTPDIIKQSVRLSKGFRRMNITFLGGEPLMVGKDWFKEAYGYIKDFSGKATTRIYTNGHLLDSEWVELFKKEKTQVVISFDGLGNGVKGAKRGLDKIQQFARDITYVTMTLSMATYKGLIDCYKQVSAAGVKRFGLQFDIYASSEEMVLLGQEVCKLFKYIEDNPNGAKFSTYGDVKSIITGKGQVMSNEFEPTVINNDYCVNADGNVTLGVPDCTDPEWQLGYVHELNHANDLMYHPSVKKANYDYIESLSLIGEFEQINQWTHGGGFFFDKKGVMPMNRPNIPKLHAYRELFRYFKEV